MKKRRTKRIPLWCQLGLHTETFLDSALFTMARRCSLCGQWLNPKAGAQVEAERKLFGEITFWPFKREA